MAAKSIEDVVGMMNKMVAREGGQVEIRHFDPAERSLVVSYKAGINDECATCAITSEMLQAFMKESLDLHSLGVDRLTVVDA